MGTRAFLVILFFWCCNFCQGADLHTIDSIKTVISAAEHDTMVCDAYYHWGMEEYLGNPDTAFLLFKKSSDIAEAALKNTPSKKLEARYLSAYADAENNMAMYYMNTEGNLSKALDHFQRCLALNKKINSIYGIANALNNIGTIYGNQGDTAKALEQYKEGLELFENSEDKKGEANVLSNIAFMFYNQGHIAKSLGFFHKSFMIREEIGDKRGMAESLNNMGTIYVGQGDHDMGLEYCQKSLKIRVEIDDKKGMGVSLNNIGRLLVQQGRYKEGLKHYHRSMEIMEDIGNQAGVARSLQHIGGTLCKLDSINKGMLMLKRGLAISSEINNLQWISFTSDVIAEWYIKSGALDSAEVYANQSARIAKQLGYPANIQRSAEKLTQIYKRQNRWEEALEKYEEFIQMRDSTKNEETQKATIRQQTKYEFEKAQLVKEQQEKEVARVAEEVTSRRNNLQYSIVLICLLAISVLVAMLGKLSLPIRMTEGIIFFAFLILFEFILVLADPYIELWSGGAPGIKLLFNAGIAALIFPMHALLESKLKMRFSKG